MILLQKKGRKPLILLAYNHTVFSFKKSKKTNTKNYETKYMHDEPDPGSNILLLLQNVNIKV